MKKFNLHAKMENLVPKIDFHYSDNKEKPEISYIYKDNHIHSEMNGLIVYVDTMKEFISEIICKENIFIKE
ncbi:hypothetical protein DMB92_03090 [Campylobacter sp. MIT 99-7217]|nr:hypothetical protein DMB92_03090 [Campylobacter sp. MIT 99-7217]